MALHANSQWLGESRSLPWRGEICGSYLHRTRLVSRAHCFRRDFRPRSPLHGRIHNLTRLWRERDSINRIFRGAWAGARVGHVIFCGRADSSFDLLEPGENVGGESASHARYGKSGGIVRNCPTSCGRHDLEEAVKGSVSAADCGSGSCYGIAYYALAASSPNVMSITPEAVLPVLK